MASRPRTDRAPARLADLDLRGARSVGQFALRRALPGLALALTLGLAPASGARASAQENELRARLERFRGEPPETWGAERTAALYDQVLDFWSMTPERWPAEESFAALVDEIHAFAEAQGHTEARLLEQDYCRLGDFLAGDRLAEGRAHGARMLELYSPALARYPELLVDQAQGARLCQEMDRVSDLLERARGLVAGRDDGPAALVPRVSLELERASYFNSVGLPELTVGVLEGVRTLIAEHAAEFAPSDLSWARSSLLLEDLNLANVLDDYERAERLLEAARAEPWYGALDPASIREHELRAAAACSDRECLDPAAPPRASALLAALLADPGLAGYELLLCETLLIDAEIRAGRLDAARAHLEAARQRLRPSRASCGAELPTRRELDLLVLEALLVLAEGDARRMRAARTSAEQALDGLLRRWSATPQHDGGLALLQTHDRMRVTGAVAELILAVEGARGPELLLELVCRVQAVGSLARALEAPAATLANVRATLVPPAGGLVVFLPGGTHSFALGLDAHALSVHVLPPVHAWEPARRRLVSELGSAQRLARPAHALDEFLAPLEAALLADGLARRMADWSSLVVVGLDGIGYVPFELLHGAGGERLGRTHALSYMPSLPVGLALARRPLADAAQRARQSLRVVAAADAPMLAERPESLVPLAFDARAAERLLARSGFSRLDVLRGAQAAPAALRVSPAETLAVHVIAHALDTGRPDRPRGLLVFPDARGTQLVLPGEVEAGPCPPLVSLMVCSSGQGPLRRGDDGRHHWGGAFLLAGARVVVLSYLDLGYQDALAFFGEMLAGLSQRGLSSAQALREARRASDPETLAPYLVHALGLADERLLPARVPKARWPWSWVGAGLLLVGTLVAWRRSGRAGKVPARP